MLVVTAMGAALAFAATAVVPAPASAATITFTYEVRPMGSVGDLEAFASLAAETLDDDRGWSLGGSIRFERVASGGQFTLWLSAAWLVPTFGPPCDSTYSCSIGRNVIINDTRWNQATPSWNGSGGSLRDYRHMVVNHEVGHWLGFGHALCGGAGQQAPVMQQQSISLQGCTHNPWPLAWERQALASGRGVPILPGGPGPAVAALTNADGRIEVFAARSGPVSHRWQWGYQPGWSPWFGMGGARPRADAVDGGRNPDGRLEVFATAPDGALVHNYQWPVAGGWAGWFPLGSGVASAPTVGANADGRFEVFATGADGSLVHTWQVAPNSGWSPTFALDGGIAHRPGLGTTADKRLVVFAVTGVGALRGRMQVAPNGGWSGPVEVGAGVTGQPAVGRNADGRMEVFAVGTDGRLRHAWQQPGGTWSGLFAVADSPTTRQAPAVTANADGRLEVFVTATDGRVYHAWQAAAAGGWSALFPLGGDAAAPPSVQVNADGRLEVFVLGRDGQVWHDWQRWAGGPWNGMVPLSG
ncbi:MAG: DUF3152 domain-containing protein [Acidimicrobiales bacterium]